MADAFGYDSDSDDELLMFVAERARNARVYRDRENHMESWTDLKFFTRFRLTKPTVLRLLALIEHHLESATDRNHSVPPITQLLLALRFYASGCMLITVGDFVGVHKSTASVIIRRVSRAIAGLRPQFVKFPDTAEEAQEVIDGFYHMSRFPHVIGCIDCTHIRIQSQGGDHAEYFRNRKSWFSLNVQTVCDHKMRIMDVVARWPGSSHDQYIFNNSAVKARLEQGEFGQNVILGDSGYAVAPYMITPLRNPILPEHQLFNEAQIRTRGTVERSYGVWKRRFPVLSLGLRLALPTVKSIIVACAVLHNMAIDMGEEDPPRDIDVPLVDIAGDEMPDVINAPNPGGNAAVQRTLIDYFRRLL